MITFSITVEKTTVTLEAPDSEMLALLGKAAVTIAPQNAKLEDNLRHLLYAAVEHWTSLAMQHDIALLDTAYRTGLAQAGATLQEKRNLWTNKSSETKA